MNIEIIDIKKVKGNSSNPRTIKDEKFMSLVRSIKEFPEMLRIRPIVVDENMVVLGGNQRLKACHAAGMKEVPIIRASELSDAQKKEFVIKDNVSFGQWDDKALQEDWGDVDLEGWGIEQKESKMEMSGNGESCSIVVYFESQDDREDFVTKAPISVSKKVGKKWNATYESNDINLF
jgi:ParB-like chromosome segregation protein Spo0J